MKSLNLKKQAQKETGKWKRKTITSIKTLQKQIESLNERLTEREAELHESLQKLADIDASKPTNQSNAMATEINKSIDEKLNTMQTTIINLMEEKLNTITKQNEDKVLAISNQINERSYASAILGDNTDKNTNSNRRNQVTPAVSNFRSIMMSTKNEELAEQRDQEIRSCNIIIHGKLEGGETTTQIL